MDDFTANEKGDKLVLKSNAVPTIFSHSKSAVKRKLPAYREREEQNESLIRAIFEDHIYTNKTTVSPPRPKRPKLEIVIPLDVAEVEVTSMPADLHQQLLRIRELEEIIVDLKKQLNEEKQKTTKCPCNKIFGSDQLHFLEKGNILGKGYFWSEKAIKTGLKLKFSCGTSGYEDILSEGFPLPAISTLQRKMEHLRFDPGVLTEVFDMLQLKVNRMGEEERWCSLTMDEVSIKKSLDYDLKSDTFLGSITLPGHSGEAAKAFCFQLGGLSTRWKQAVGYHFTGNHTGIVL